MQTLTLEEWLTYLSNLHPKTIDLSLGRISIVAKRLALIGGNAFKNTYVISVAGTNGKGSCVGLLETAMLASHYKVGAYYSPHLVCFNERIRIAGKEVEDKPLCEAFQTVEKARENIELTYFEFTTLAALLIFKEAQLDIMILEVGLGGRLDAVNMIDADLAIISSIGIDHTDYLGPTRETIAFEKAGIMRKQCNAICGDPDPPSTLLDFAQNNTVSLYCQNREFGYKINRDQTWNWWYGNITFANLPWPQVHINNASTIMMAFTLLQKKFAIAQKVIHTTLATMRLPGRCHTINGPVTIILDVAHNPEAANYLARYLKSLPREGRILAVFGMLKDKDIANTIHPMIDIIDHWYVAGLHEPRGAEVALISEALIQNHLNNYDECADIVSAHLSAMQDAVIGDKIVIFGSFHTVAPFLT